MKTNTVKGTNDYLPSQVALRDYLQSVILKTYQNHGFERIMTPILEDIENLDKSEGGENLNLIFKVLKRGDKLSEAIENQQFKENELADMGLRYDLTLPLSRYYANNRARLGYPVKCIQIDRVYRAERPQKGRLREFIQCDIDIIGSSSNSCEIELIDTTAKALLAIGIKNFVVKINDRRLLKNVLLTAGFLPEQLDSVCITIDKFDKVGTDGVREELTEKGFATESIEKMINIFGNLPLSLEDVKKYCTDEEALNSVETIMNAVNEINDGNYSIQFDISLVRGQGYYTGTIFEIQSLDFKGSIAGGGRYDNLIGKFIGEDIPAVGFSIGFERIFAILSETGYEIPGKKKIAMLFDEADVVPALKKADELRADYDVVMYVKPKKLGKFLNKLEEQGLAGFYNFGQADEVKIFGE
ncbi:MAG: histidine--tRNA ligase [Thermoflexaceae bacterium]|nr:histidine--tRNA ligase [Thermoflexaceae bacterium]